MRRKQEDPSIHMQEAQESRNRADRGIAAEFTEICSRNSSMTDLAKIGASEDGTTNPVRIGSKRDCITDPAEISGRGVLYDRPCGD